MPYKPSCPTFRSFLVLLIAAFLVFFGIAFSLTGGSRLFGWTGFILAESIAALLIWFLLYARESLGAQASILALFFVLYVFPRLVQYLVAPATVMFPFGGQPEPGGVAAGLAFVFMGTLALVGGFHAGDALSERFFRDPAARAPRIVIFPVRALGAMFAFAVLVSFYSFFVCDVSHLGKLRLDRFNALLQMGRIVFNVDSVFYVFLIALLLRRRYVTTKRSYWIPVLVGFFIANASLSGSRSITLRVISYLLCFYLGISGDFRFNPFKTGLVVAALGAVSLALFPVNTQIRKNLSTIARMPSVTGSPVARAAYQPATEESKVTAERNTVQMIADRFGIIDYPILMVSTAADPGAKRSLMTLSYAGKSLINFCVPGDPFPAARISTSRLIPVLYRGIPFEYIEQRDRETAGYFSEFYTVWGIVFLLFGWGGGAVALFIIALLLQAFYRLNQRCGKFSMYCRPLALLLVFSLYASMGLDHTASFGITLYVSTAFTIAGGYVLARVSGKRVIEIQEGKERGRG